MHLSALVTVEAGLGEDRHRVVHLPVDQRVRRDADEDGEKQSHVHQEQSRVGHFAHVRSENCRNVFYLLFA